MLESHASAMSSCEISDYGQYRLISIPVILLYVSIAWIPRNQACQTEALTVAPAASKISQDPLGDRELANYMNGRLRFAVRKLMEEARKTPSSTIDPNFK